MRILHVCADGGIPPDGTKGASVHFRSLHQALRHEGANVIAVMARLGKQPLPEMPNVVPLDQLEALLSGSEPTVVLERYALGHDGTLALCQATRTPHILEVNAPLVDEATKHRPTTVRDRDREIEHRLWSMSDTVLCVSRPLAELVGAHRNGVTDIVRNGFDPALVEGPPPTLRRVPTLGFLGHPKPWHGTSSLPELLRSPALAGLGTRLLVIGGGDGADALRAAVSGTELESRVEVTGPVPQHRALSLLRETHVAIAPYPRDEHFYFCPLKVIEAMGAGVPVVSVDQGDLNEIVGGGGILVAPGDSHAMAKACARILVDGSVRRGFAEVGRARALASLTWRHAALKVLGHASSLIGRITP